MKKDKLDMKQKKKIAVVCMSTPNYGNNLVNMTLEKEGHDVTMVFPPGDYTDIVRCRSFYFSNDHYDNRKMIFPNTYKELVLLNQLFDIFVVGGDQVFRFIFQYPAGGFFSLDWVSPDKTKVCVGTSFGQDGYEEKHPFFREREKYWFNHFSMMLVREQSGEELLKEYFEIDTEVKTILDPVLLCEPGYITSIADDISFDKKYMAVYFLDKSEKKMKGVQAIADKYYSGRIIEYLDISGETEKISGFDDNSDRDHSRGEEWLCVIKKSDFLITDSFHGICMALMLHKQFCVMVPDKFRGMIRIREILNTCELQDRLISDFSDFIDNDFINQEIDYEIVDNILAQKRKESLMLIENALCRESECSDDFWEIYINKAGKFMNKNEQDDFTYIAWGAGDIFRRTLPYLRTKGVKYVCDMRENLWGSEADEGIEIISKEDLKRFDKVFIIVTIDSWIETMNIFKAMKDQENIVGIENVLERQGNEIHI